MSDFTQKNWQKFVFGGTGGVVAGFTTNPMDVIKVRLQLQGELLRQGRGDRVYKGLGQGLRLMLQREGIQSWFKGGVPNIYREATYSTLRLGLYEPAKALVGAKERGLATPLWQKILAGAMAGATAGAITNPFDLVKVRLQAPTLGSEPRYSGVPAAFRAILREGGIWKGLYRGVGPNIQRAMLVTATQVPSYDHSKYLLVKWGVVRQDAWPAHFLAAIFAGLCTAFVTGPFDIAKTRIYQQTPESPGLLYRNTLHVWSVIVPREGVKALWKGFLPSWARLGPHTIICFLVWETLRGWFGVPLL